MSRNVLIAFILLLAIMPTLQAHADPGPKPRSRLVAAIVERFAPGYDKICFIGNEVSSPLKYRWFELPPSFYERFVIGKFNEAQVNEPRCPTPERKEDDCHMGCVVVMVFDFTAFGHATNWEPWPTCSQETITFTRSYNAGPTGRLVLTANIYRDGSRNSLTVVEPARCTYNIHEEQAIE